MITVTKREARAMGAKKKEAPPKPKPKETPKSNELTKVLIEALKVIKDSSTYSKDVVKSIESLSEALKEPTTIVTNTPVLNWEFDVVRDGNGYIKKIKARASK